MKCRQVSARLSDYIDQRLPPGAVRSVETHLESCPDCSRELEQLRSLVGHLGRLDELEPPPEVKSVSLALVRAERRREKRAARRRFHRTMHQLVAPQGVAVVVALACIVVCFAVYLGTFQGAEQPMAEMEVGAPGEQAVPIRSLEALRFEEAGEDREMAAPPGPAAGGEGAVPAAAKLRPEKTERKVTLPSGARDRIEPASVGKARPAILMDEADGSSLQSDTGSKKTRSEDRRDQAAPAPEESGRRTYWQRTGPLPAHPGEPGRAELLLSVSAAGGVTGVRSLQMEPTSWGERMIDLALSWRIVPAPGRPVRLRLTVRADRDGTVVADPPEWVGELRED